MQTQVKTHSKSIKNALRNLIKQTMWLFFDFWSILTSNMEATIIKNRAYAPPGAASEEIHGRTPFPDLILEASGRHFGGSGTSFWRFFVSMLMIILPPNWFFAPYFKHNIIIVRKGFGMGFRIQITFSCALFACSFSPKGRAPCSRSAGSNNHYFSIELKNIWRLCWVI